MPTNRNCILRLSRYRNALLRFKSLGFVKIFSDNLAEETGVTAPQVRKDFSLFGITGNKRGGYNIEELLEKLNNLLGKTEIQNVIIVGAGHIGTALMKYRGFEKEGFKILAVFDIDPTKYNREVNKIPVMPLAGLENFVKNNRIKAGIIATPDLAAMEVYELMKAAGIKGVLNFAPIRLKETPECVVNNVNIELELENLLYYVNALNKEKKLKKFVLSKAG